MDSFAFYITMLRKDFINFCSEKLSEIGVTYGQLFIIIYIGKKENCSPKEISLALNLDAGHLNRTLIKLIENNLISQKKNEIDKRANIVTLTEKGKNVFKMSHDLFYQWDKTILDNLTDKEKEDLLTLIKKIKMS